jgi:hypothetical protein
MHRIQRAFVALSLLLGLAMVAAPGVFRHADAAVGPGWHSGRLGGGQATFDARFGEGKGSASKGITYHATGYGAFVVKFDKDRAVDIVLTPDGASWTAEQAFTVSLDLLPEGVRLVAEASPTGDGRWEMTCQSDKLARAFTRSDYKRLKHAGQPGECFVLESPDSPTTFNGIELSVGRAGGLENAAPTATATTKAPLTILTPTPTPDTRTFIGQDGCTYMVATGAFVSCPPPADTGGGTSGGGGGSSGGGAVVPGGGATALCNDGTYSYAANHQGACSHHGGVAEWYK